MYSSPWSEESGGGGEGGGGDDGDGGGGGCGGDSVTCNLVVHALYQQYGY